MERRILNSKTKYATRFKKGVSGNPKGRPKNSAKKLSFADLVMAELSTSVEFFEAGIKRKSTKIELLIKQAYQIALKGDVSMMKFLIAVSAPVVADQQIQGVYSQIGDAKKALAVKLARIRQLVIESEGVPNEAQGAQQS